MDFRQYFNFSRLAPFFQFFFHVFFQTKYFSRFSRFSVNHELERSGIQCRGPGVRGPVSQRGSGAREGLGVKEGPRESEGPGNQRCPVVRGAL